MKMVSYAQNGEDVMLARALHGIQHGFYIDVGAAGPTEHSVTRTFYDRGWTGLNVEPTRRFFDALAAARPHDINIRAALDATAGDQTFYAFEGTGLSTLDAQVAENHKPGGWPMTRTEVRTRTLADLCEEWAPPAIHFLKIDVEGAEERVLRGADFARFRPWITVVEATRPMSPEPDFAAWEPILTAAGYEFVWFDGLNRFYLAAEHADRLRPHFRLPVNFFDDFDLYNPVAERLKAELAATRARTAEADAETGRLRSQLQVHALLLEEDAQLRSHAASLQAEASELRHQVHLRDAELAARHADFGARLATQHEHTHHRRLAQEHAEARVAELQAHLETAEHILALQADPDAAAVPAPGPRPPGARGLLVALYRATLRPVLRPALWRTRSFLLAGLRREQVTLHEHQRRHLAALEARLTGLHGHLDTVAANLQSALAARPEPAPPPPAASPADVPHPATAELAALARSMETALTTLAITAALHRPDTLHRTDALHRTNAQA